MQNLVGLKEILDELVEQEDFHITYASLRQAYRYGTLDKSISKFIVEKKKPSSVSYYVEQNELDNFKQALFKYFC